MPYLPIPGYEGLYEVSDTGLVRSVDRKVTGRDGTVYPFKGRALRPYIHKDTGYTLVSLWKGGKGASWYVHRLVALVHIPNPEGLPEVNHLDGVRTNARKDNLEWVTSQENKLHAIEAGLRVYTNRLTEDEFAECLQSVISGESYGSLCRRVPYQVPYLSTKLRKLARKWGVEHDLDASLYEQAVLRARVNGAKNHQAH